MNRISWKEIILGTVAGLSILTSPAAGKTSGTTDEPSVRMDNRGPGSLNSGRGDADHSGRGRHGGDDALMAQIGDVRQEDRRADRRLDRREDRREDRQLDRREDRRANRQIDRREDHRSNPGGELRGLDRADHVAGDHGREGRENARMMHMERPNRPERFERPERPERSERSDRPERGGRN